ncbi:hypothetical protein [Gloeobacter violaceus]|uniref:Glr4361 protein n=1 Tax=Gloeobacter violaceus (strain ATCC 29082 / PCC 7421) TaxID=251221 RepID=Q7ND75_GLOVI|nr:hypothetical protein [Gloeobacter violaceus]BAC92302.1 glr4361 [Gloeobacter violaceus PCC 7421]
MDRALPLERYDLYLLAGRLLAHHLARSGGVQVRAIEVALAVQYFQDLVPVVGSGGGIGLDEVAERICDGLYRKSDGRLPHGPKGETLVWPILNLDSEGVPQPLLPQSSAEGDFRWHKLCNGQRGIGCHAAAIHFWQDVEFLEGDRDLCPFRVYDGHTSLVIDQGRQKCGFDGNPCGWQPGLPKFLQVLGRGRQARLSRVAWTVPMWQALVPAGQALPVYPLLAALYFGAPQLAKGRGTITPEQFRCDFGLTEAVFAALFEAAPEHPLNRRLLTHLDAPPAGEPLSPRFVLPVLPPERERGRPSGGRLVIDPDEKPAYQKSGVPGGSARDPLLAERRRRRQLERTARHDEVLTHFRRWFRLAGKEVREDADTFDFLAIDEQQVLLAEIKVLGQQDLAEAIQETVGQLLYYQRFALAPWREEGYPIAMAAVFERPPIGEFVTFLGALNIHTYWIGEDQHIDGPEESLALIRSMGVQVHADPELMRDA